MTKYGGGGRRNDPVIGQIQAKNKKISREWQARGKSERTRLKLKMKLRRKSLKPRGGKHKHGAPIPR